jgi:segregation and condensation protein A
MSENYSVKLPVFEGPMDLLLHLIKENQIDIYDIPIAVITRQYLEYLEIMKDLDLEVAGEFLVMAATLIQIKSRMLLPVGEAAPEEEAEDPRLELVHRLLEYQAYKEASMALREMGLQSASVYYREGEAPGSEAADDTGELSLFDISMFDLFEAFRKLLENAPPDVVNVTKETLTVKDSISRILQILEQKETVRFEELFAEEGCSRARMLVTFIALLEMLKLGLARVYQELDFGAIWVLRPAPGGESGGEQSTEASGTGDIASDENS